MNSPVGSLGSLRFPTHTSSLSHTASISIEPPQTIPEELRVARWQAAPFVRGYVWKDGKSLCQLCASASEKHGAAYLHCSGVWGWRMKQSPGSGCDWTLRSLCECERETRSHRGVVRILKQATAPITNKDVKSFWYCFQVVATRGRMDGWGVFISCLFFSNFFFSHSIHCP